ncbi:MAG: hypothetical protein KF861_09885 [Planctomycetaceae bacterium]|nr:hypothetical protein [Planctomycetaceae bacterium]
MQLQEFVAETLRQVIAGVAEAQKGAAEHDAAINPRGTKNHYTLSAGAAATKQVKTRAKSVIEFDVAVTTTDASNSEAGAGAMIAVLGIGMKRKEGVEQSMVSRVRFAVPVLLPAQPES